MKTVQLLFEEIQHAHTLQPLWEALADTNEVNIQVGNIPIEGADVYVVPVDTMINLFPESLYDKIVWIDHGLGRNKPNVPFDFMTKIKLNLVESDWTKQHILDNIAIEQLPWRKGGASFTTDNIVTVGYPNNDELWRTKDSVNWSMPEHPTILYAPTWSLDPPTDKLKWEGRNRGNSIVTGQTVVQTALSYANTLFVKEHELGFHLDVPVAANCIFANPLNSCTTLLKMADILITDCSSVAVEFAILDRPIIEIVDNLHETLLLDIGIQTTAENLGSAIELAMSEPSLHSDKRDKWVKRTNYICDSNSSVRAAEAILKLLASNPL